MLKLILFVISLLGLNGFAQNHNYPYICKGQAPELFRSKKPLELDILANFRGLNESSGVKRSLALISYKSVNNKRGYLLGELHLRGNSRLRYCKKKPIEFFFENEKVQKMLFSKLLNSPQSVKEFAVSALDEYRSHREINGLSNGSIKEGLFSKLGKKIKLVGECGAGVKALGIASDEDSKYRVLAEHALYGILDTLDSYTYKTRLLKINYRDLNGNLLYKEYGFIRERLNSLARRCRFKEKPINSVTENPSAWFRVEFFNRIVSSHDFKRGHNHKTLYDQDYYYMIPYDFDLTWIGLNPYAYSLIKDELPSSFTLENELYLTRRLLNERELEVSHSIHFLSKREEIIKNIQQIPFSEKERRIFLEWLNLQFRVFSDFIAEFIKKKPSEFSLIRKKLIDHLEKQ